MIELDFKSPRQRAEFESGNLNSKLLNMLYSAIQYLRVEYPTIDYKLVLTEIFRTQPEQDKIYLNANDPAIVEKYKKAPWQSVHQYWNGVDIRTYNMPKGMKDKLLSYFLTYTYDKKRPEKKTAIWHNLGTGEHIHLQSL